MVVFGTAYSRVSQGCHSSQRSHVLVVMVVVVVQPAHGTSACQSLAKLNLICQLILTLGSFIFAECMYNFQSIYFTESCFPKSTLHNTSWPPSCVLKLVLS